MIHRLRRRFIAIAMTSVTLVMCLMALSINVFNFLSTDGALSDTLRVIYENQGSIPPPPEGGPDGPPGGRFTQETPYSTRYFILAYRGDGTLELADMRHIAAVTEEDADTYLSIALAHGEGMGYTEEYKYCVIHTGKDRYAAIFLDCQQELYSVRTFAWISLLVVAVCVILVYILIWLFSKKAIEPTVKSVEKQKQFITDASHELKTPLTVITTSLKVLEMEIGGQKWIDKARGQAEKMDDINVGTKIAQFRALKKMTAKELAQKANITSSMLSQVERNRVNPSLQTLRDIADALDTPLFYFFKDDRPADGIVVRKDRRKTLGYPGERDVHYQLLTPDTTSNIEFCLMELPPLCDLRPPPLVSRRRGGRIRAGCSRHLDRRGPVSTP